MTAPAFVYTSEPWAAHSFGRPIFAPAFTRERMSAGHLPQSSSASRFMAGAFGFPDRSSIRHQSDCGMHPLWRCLGSRIEYRNARPRVDSGRGGLGCGVHGETRQTLGKHRESPPAEPRVRPSSIRSKAYRNTLSLARSCRMRSNEPMPLSSQATASPPMMQDIDLQGVA
jgi:hypothetical protein